MTLNAAASLGLAARDRLARGRQVGRPRWSSTPPTTATSSIIGASTWSPPSCLRGRVAWRRPDVTNFAKLSLGQFLDALASDAPTPGGGTAAAVARRHGRGAGPDGRGPDALEGEVRRVARRRPPDRRGGAARPRGVPRSRPGGLRGLRRGRRRPAAPQGDRRAEGGARPPDRGRQPPRPRRCPMRTARAAVRLLAALPELAEKGNPNAASDVGAAALLLDACVEGALLNVGHQPVRHRGRGLREPRCSARPPFSRRSRSVCAPRSWRSSARDSDASH